MSAVVKLIIFGVILVVVISLIFALPAISLDKDSIISSSAWYWITSAMYFIPTHTVVSILSVIVSLGIFSLIVAVVKTIWDVLPFS